MTALQKYLEHADGVTGYRSSLGRMNALVGDSKANQALAIKDSVWTVAGGAAGAVVGYKYGHPLLGLISGGSIGRNGPALLKATTRKEGMWNLAQTHGGVIASYAMPENKAWGFVLGWVAVGIARYLYGDEQ